MLTERELQISPIVQESVLHNTKVRPVPALLPHHTSPPLLLNRLFSFLLFVHLPLDA